MRNPLRRVTLLLLILLVFNSCASVENEGNMSTEPEVPTEDARGEIDLKREDRIQVPGAIDFRVSEYRELLNTAPLKGKPVFFVVVSRMYNREDEYEMGRRLLARQAAIFQNALVRGKALTVSNSRYEGTREVVDISYNESSMASLYDRIRVVEYYEDNMGTYMKGVLSGISLPSFEFAQNGEGDVPAWFLEMPQYPGYLTAVGVSQRQMYFYKSLLESEEQTLLHIARQLNIGVSKERADIEIEGKGAAHRQSSLEEVETQVKGFYILDRHISADGNTFYTLAVCPIK